MGYIDHRTVINRPNYLYKKILIVRMRIIDRLSTYRILIPSDPDGQRENSILEKYKTAVDEERDCSGRPVAHPKGIMY